MGMVRMDIRNIVVSNGPIPSAIILKPHSTDGDDSRAEVLPINVGVVESSSIGAGIEHRRRARPMTHDLFLDVLDKLGARLESVSITSVEGPTFKASLTLTDADGRTTSVDSRPSDAMALAVRRDAPILVDERVLSTAAVPDFDSIRKEERDHELAEFHDFLESISPEDFVAASQGGGTGDTKA